MVTLLNLSKNYLLKYNCSRKNPMLFCMYEKNELFVSKKKAEETIWIKLRN